MTLTVNKNDIETAVDMAEESNKALINEIIDPASGLIVHDTVNIDSQLDFEKNDLNTTFRLSNALQERLDNILDDARKKVSSLKFPGKAVVEIPNDSLSAEKKNTKSEDIYFDNSFKEMLKPKNLLFFPQSSIDDRRDFG